MTKQEFAIKLLFWLMPWPLSKALPRILRRILAGPARATPLQWAQAAYDALTQFLSDAMAYAETLFDIIPHIPPTDQLIEAAPALTTAIETAGLATDFLTPIIADLDAYTPDQIWQAFSDAIDAMDQLLSAIPDLVDAIQQIAPDQLADLAPPPPPPLPGPINFLNPYMPGPGGAAFVHPALRRPWTSFFDDNYWDADWHVNDHISWTGSVYLAAWDEPGATDAELRVKLTSTWYLNYRPTKMRITWTAQANMVIALRDSSNNLIGQAVNYISGDEITLDFTATGDIYLLFFIPFPQVDVIATISNIEFFGG